MNQINTYQHILRSPMTNQTILTFALAYLSKSFGFMSYGTSRGRKTVSDYAQSNCASTQCLKKCHAYITPLNARYYPTDLDTAYEWIANDRYSKDPERIQIRWFHPTEIASQTNNFHLEDVELGYQSNLSKMPLYPLGMVHVPYSMENYTLNNIEERNVNMAMDLLNNQWPSSLFCVALRARDTNRIASVATVMQVLEIENRSVRMHNKMVVTCKAVGIADVVSIDNPRVWNDEYVGGEYLVANVQMRPLSDSNTQAIASKEFESKTITGSTSIPHQLLSNYQGVKNIYSNSRSITSNELPPYAREAILTMKNFTISDIMNEHTFWSFIETWQMLCNTIRQAKRSQLTSMVNEISVEVAMQLGGPLELPVKRSSLPNDVQWKLNEMEQSASRDFMELGVDPVLDFQILIEMKDHEDRVEKVGEMVRNELLRLEAKESLIQALQMHDQVELSDDSDIGRGFS